MRQSFVKLIEAVRGLKLAVTEREAGRAVSIGLPKEEISPRMLDLYDALQEVDRDGATEMADARRMREALDVTFRWIRMQGLSLDEPVELVSQILGVKTGKKQASYDIMPSYAPQHTRKKGWKPVMKLPGDRLSAIRSISDHRKIAGNMSQVVDRMGAAAPEEASPSPGLR